MKFCHKCKTQNRQIDFIGKLGNVKLFESTCLNCGHNYIYRFNAKNKSVKRTGNLNIYKINEGE